MSELKAYRFLGQDEVWPDANLGSNYYLKSEADKVIAELEDKLRAANEQIENLINSASSIMLFQDRVKDNKCAELRHQKFKRCLKMAELCRAKRDEIIARTPTLILSHHTEYLTRWERRWLELAEKFKEAIG